MDQEVQKQNIGNAGEYYIAARLSALNFTATLTLGRAERYDILAVNPEGKTYKLSIKTRFTAESTAFTLSEKDCKDPADDLFYVFVRLHGFKTEPEFWVIPSARVSEVISAAHEKWLITPGRNNQQHNITSMRKLPIVLRGRDSEYYLGDWENELSGYYKNFSPLCQKQANNPVI